MSGWNGNGNGAEYARGGFSEEEEEPGFGYASEPEPEPAPEPERAYRSARTARPQNTSRAAPPARPQAPRPQPTLGAAADDMGYIASLVDRYVTTPEFLAAQVAKIARDPEADDVIGAKLRPYVIFAVGGGLVFGFVGAWLYRKWAGLGKGGLLKGMARKLLA